MTKWKLKRHESFHLREGWLEKALNAYKNNEIIVFGKESGIKLLGVGSNMVKSIRFWLLAAGLIDTNNKATELMKTIIKYDEYIEHEFTWWILHINLTENYDEIPVFNVLFNNIKTNRFTKEYLIDVLKEYALDNDIDESNFGLLQDDVSVFLRTYANQKMENPEDNINSPFGKLELFEEKERNVYSFNITAHDKLNYLVFYYSLLKLNVDSINAEDLFETVNSPAKILRLDKNQFYSYLNMLKNEGLITLNRTAGLNMVYVEKKMDTDRIFEMYFKEVK